MMWTTNAGEADNTYSGLYGPGSIKNNFPDSSQTGRKQLLSRPCLNIFFQCSFILAASFLIISACGNNDENGKGGSGEIGAPCPAGPGSCPSGVHITGDGVCYCSAYCRNDEDICPGDFPCQRYPFDGDHRDICAPACTRDNLCASGSCDTETGKCEAPKEGDVKHGDFCSHPDSICVYGLICIHQVSPRCMESCRPSLLPLCENGAICYEASAPEGGICMLGGDAALNSPCSSEFDCMTGYICTLNLNEQICRPACDLEGEPCEDGMGECSPTGSGRLGVCLP